MAKDMKINKDSESDLDSKQERPCRYCLESINVKAKVCHHCNRHQSRIWENMGYSNTVLSIITIFLVILAFLQFSEARKDRIEANEALLKATEAEQNVIQLRDILHEEILSLIRMTAMQLEIRNELGDSQRLRKAGEEISKEVNMLLFYIIPDEAERKKWLQELEQRIPDKE